MILYALGCLPVQLSPVSHELAGTEPFLPKYFCTLSKLTLARALAGESLAVDGVILANTCDAQRRLLDVSRTCVNIPVRTCLEVARRSDPLDQDSNLYSCDKVSSKCRHTLGLAARLHETCNCCYYVLVQTLEVMT